MRFIFNFVITFSYFLVLATFYSKVALAQSDKEFSVIQLREISYQHSPAIRVRFSEPVNVEKAEGKVQLVESENGQVKLTGTKYAWVMDKDKRALIFPFVEPDTEYQVLVNAELESHNGIPLGDYYAETIKTKFLAEAANFSSTGYLMSLSGQKTLPVTVTNVDEVDVNFYYATADKYSAFLKSGISAGTEYNYQLDRLAENTEFIYSSRFKLTPKKNQRTFLNLDVSHVTQLQKPGLYIAVMSKAGRFESRHSVIHFTVSDLALHFRQYQHKSIAQVINLSKGKPEPNVELSVYDKSGSVLALNMTNEDGVGELVIQNQNSASYLVAKKNSNLSILPLRQSTLDLSDFNNALTPHADIQAFSFGPRDIFRPGETAQVQVLLRDYDGQALSNIPLNLTLTRPDGQIVQDVVLQPEAVGYYQFNYQLAQSALTGMWTVNYQAVGQKLGQSYSFKVEDFRPNRLQLEQLVAQKNTLINSANSLLLKNEKKLSNHIKGQYLFGANASGNKVDGVVNAKFDRHPIPDYKAFFFGDQRETLYFKNRHIRALKLDPQGEGKISMHNPWGNISSPLRLTYTLSLYDGGGQPTTSVQPVTLVKGNGFVGIKPNFSGEPDKNAKVGFSVVTLGANLTPTGGEYLTVSLVKEDRNYYWSHDSHRGWQFKYDSSPYEVWTGEVITDEHGVGTFELPLEFGHYQLLVTNPKNSITSTFDFKTAGRWWSNSSESKNKPDSVLMSFDKSSYVSGERAQLSYFAPHSGQAWFTVENNNGVLYQDSFEVTQGQNTLSFDLPDSWDRHDNYATLMIVKRNEKLQSTKTRALGVVYLPITRSEMELDVSLSVPESSLPLKKVSSKIKVNNDEILVGDTYAVAALVDVGVLNITKYRRPKPELYFLAPRRYQVELADVYSKLIEQNDGQILAQNFGGDLVESEDELARGGKKPDADVQILSLLSDPVKLDDNGEADIAFELPEFTGRVRWSVVVFNKNQFGSAEQFTQVSSPFVSHISSPYFLAPGDSSKAILELHNTTDELLEITAKIGTSGGISQLDMNESLKVSANSKEQIVIDLKANDTLVNGEINYELTTSDYNVRKQHTVPIRLAYPAQTKADYFTLDKGEAWNPTVVLEDLISGSAQGQLLLSSTPPLELNNYFDSLLTYPYGCLEQTASRALPWLYTDSKLVEQYSLNEQIESRLIKPYSESLRLGLLQKALEGLQQKQRVDGSFSLWAGAQNEYSWLTVYAADVLVEAVKSGVLVPEGMMSSALNVVRKYLKRSASVKVSSWSDHKAFYRNSVRTYAALVLAKAKRASLSDLRRLETDLVGQSAVGSLSWVQLAASFKVLGAEIDSQKAIEKAQKLARPSGYIGDYGSAVRDLAWSYSLSLQFDLDLELDFVALTTAIDERQWLSTQDKARLFVLASLLTDDSETFNSIVKFAKGNANSVDDRSRFNSLLSEKQLTELSEVKATEGKIYGHLIYSFAQNQEPKAKSDIISIEKTYYDFEGYPTDLEKIKSGQLLIVELTIESTKNMRDALVVDLLPAGVLIENQNLSNASVDINNLEIAGEAIKQPVGLIYQEFREDRYVASLPLKKDQPLSLFYLVRAAAEGTYTIPAAYIEDMFNPMDHGIGETSILKINE